MRVNYNTFPKNANTSLVTQLLWRRSGLSRVDIARQLNLYRSTVTNIVATLIENDVVYEGEEGSGMSRGGRKPISLRLNDRFGCVIGFDIQPSHYRAVIMDILGNTLHEDSGKTPDQPFEEILVFLMDKLLSEVEKLGLPALAVVFGIPGIVDPHQGIIHWAASFKLENFDIYTFLSERYDLFVFVENDANCTAWLEMTVHRSELLGDFICIMSDYHEGSQQFEDWAGIGAGIGISIDGKVYHGSHNSSGEIHTFTWRGGEGQTGLDVELLKRSVEEEEAWRTWVVDIFASLVPVVSVLDPEKVFILGKPFSNKELMLGTLTEEAPQFLDVLKKIDCELVFDSADELAVAKGAATMFLQKLFSVPELGETGSKTHFEWEDILAKVQSKNKNKAKKPTEVRYG